MLNPLPCDVGLQPASETAGTAPVLKPDTLPSGDFESEMESVMKQPAQQLVPVDTQSGSEPEAAEAEAIPLAVALSLESLKMPQAPESVEGAALPNTQLPDLAADESEIVVAYASLSESSSDGELTVKQIMPLLGGGGHVDPALGRVHLSTDGPLDAAIDPRMSQPLQDAVGYADAKSMVPVQLDPLHSLPVQELLDPKAIEAKEELRQEALTWVRENESPSLHQVVGQAEKPHEIASSDIADKLQFVQTVGATETEDQGLERVESGLQKSAPWIGLPEGGVSPQTLLSRNGSAPVVSSMAAIEHALMAADLKESTPGQLAEQISSMPGGQPQALPEQSSSWTRALLDSNSPLNVAQSVDAESSEDSGGEADADLDFDDSRLREPVSTTARSRSGGVTRQLQSQAGPQLNAQGEPIAPQSTTTVDSDALKSTRVARATPQAQMTPQMAMATDDVAEFTVVEPNRMDLRIQDLEGDLELSVAREEEGISVKVRAPREVIEDFQGMEQDVESALAEDDQNLSSFDTEVSDGEQGSLGSEAGSDEEGNDKDLESSRLSTAPGARILSRIV